MLPSGISRHGTTFINWYLLEEAGKLTVIDAGFPTYWPQLLQGIQERGYQLEDIQALILTHAHADHKGFAEGLRRATGVTVWVHEADRDLACRWEPIPPRGFIQNLWRPFVRSFFLEATRDGAFSVPPLEKVSTFQDGDVLDVPGHPQVIHTPGHTPGECVFYLPERETLFSGDTLVTASLYNGHFGRPQLLANGLNHNTYQARRSLQKLERLGHVTMLPGHGEPWSGDMEEAVRGAYHQ